MPVILLLASVRSCEINIEGRNEVIRSIIVNGALSMCDNELLVLVRRGRL